LGIRYREERIAKLILKMENKGNRVYKVKSPDSEIQTDFV
jgi:hypothetical protein